MSDKAQEILLGTIIEPPESDSIHDEIENRYDETIFQSSAFDIIDSIGTEEFKMNWLVLKQDIQQKGIIEQRQFVISTLEKIKEYYDFEFPRKIDYDTQDEIDEFYKFLEFLEYDNVEFLSKVWFFLRVDNILQLNLKEYCNSNQQLIIKEIDEQNELMASKIIRMFLRSLYLEKIIEWFYKKTLTSKIEIQSNVLIQRKIGDGY